MSVYKAVLAAAESRGDIELPDGNVYAVAPITVGELLRLESLNGKPEIQSIPAYVAIAKRVTGAPGEALDALTPKQLIGVIAASQFGVEAVAKAMADEAAASGNGAAPVAAPTKPSTSRKKR